MDTPNGLSGQGRTASLTTELALETTRDETAAALRDARRFLTRH